MSFDFNPFDLFGLLKGHPDAPYGDLSSTPGAGLNGAFSPAKPTFGLNSGYSASGFAPSQVLGLDQTSDTGGGGGTQPMNVLQKLGKYFTDPASGVDRQKVALGAVTGVGSLYSMLHRAHLENEDRKRQVASANAVAPDYAAIIQRLGSMMQPPPKPPGT